jgi:4-carboxymuconolactone decarboxylase
VSPMAADRELPDLADLVGTFFGQCSPTERRVLLAGAERLAAQQYRQWAEQAGDEDRDGFLAAAEREERVADVLEKLTPDAAETARALDERFPMLPVAYRSMLQGRNLRDQFAIQSVAERAGGELLRAFAEREGDAEARDALLVAAGLEEANAGFLDALVGARPEAPRLSPLSDEEQDEHVRELLEEVRIPGAEAVNIFETLVRHPGLFRRWMPFAGKLLVGKLPARDRELLILRTAWHCRSPYEWGQHDRLAQAAGISDDEIERVAAGPDAPEWAPFDRTLLTAADELHDDACIGDRTWSSLAERYDEKQLIEVPMLVGHYHMVAYALNSLGVQREPGVPGLPDRRA